MCYLITMLEATSRLIPSECRWRLMSSTRRGMTPLPHCRYCSTQARSPILFRATMPATAARSMAQAAGQRRASSSLWYSSENAIDAMRAEGGAQPPQFRSRITQCCCLRQPGMRSVSQAALRVRAHFPQRRIATHLIYKQVNLR